MSAADAPPLSVLAFQLAAALQTYEQEIAAMVQAPMDQDLYRRASRQLDRMRTYAASLPALSGAWVELMIRHFELSHGLWRQQGGEAVDLAPLHEHLRAAIARLSRRCLQLVPAA
jgi:hypothetical protein